MKTDKRKQTNTNIPVNSLFQRMDSGCVSSNEVRCVNPFLEGVRLCLCGIGADAGALSPTLNLERNKFFKVEK